MLCFCVLLHAIPTLMATLVSRTDFTNAQAFFVSACEQATKMDKKLVNKIRL